MSVDVGQDATLYPEGVPVFLDHDFVLDDDGIIHLESTITISFDDEAALRVSKGLYELVDEHIDALSDFEDYHTMYAIAAEFTKEAERIREVANRIEDSVRNVADLFKTAYVPPT